MTPYQSCGWFKWFFSFLLLDRFEVGKAYYKKGNRNDTLQNEPKSFLGWQFYDFQIYVSTPIVQIDLLYNLQKNCLKGHLEKIISERTIGKKDIWHEHSQMSCPYRQKNSPKQQFAMIANKLSRTTICTICKQNWLEEQFAKNMVVQFSIATIWLRAAPRGPMAAPLDVWGATLLEDPGGQTLRPRFSSSGDF